MYKILVENGDIIKDLSNSTEPIVGTRQLIMLVEDNPIIDNGTFRDLTSNELLKFNRHIYKIDRQLLVDNIEIEYNGVVYQGDETSQDRMSRAINGLPDDTSTVYWKAKDNSKQELNRIQLKEILYLAGQEQTIIWFNELTI